jgi:ankyrin repeat protein
LDAEEEAIKVERAAKKEETYKENLAQAAAKKAARDAEEAAQKAEEDARLVVLNEEQKIADELKAAEEAGGEAVDESTILGDIRDSDRVAVAQSDLQKTVWDDKNDALRDEKLSELMSQIKTDECNHSYWLSEDSSEFDNDSLAARRRKSVATVKWLAEALKYSFLHEDIEAAATKLLQSRLTPQLQNLQQFLPLKEMLKERAEELGELLASVHAEQHLRLKLSDKRVQKAYKLHPLVEGFEKVTNLLIIDQLKGKGHCNPPLLDYEKPERMDEMAALQVILLSARAVNDAFQSTMKELAAPFADVHNGAFTAAPPKTFARPYNKGISETDYRYDELPRAASQCKDGVRNLIVVKSVADLLGLVKAMSDKFGGLGGLKNPFALSDVKKGERNHLLLMNIVVVYEDESTYEDMFTMSSTKTMVTEYTKKIQMLPRDRWNGSIDKAVHLMTNDAVMKKEKVKVLGEVQVLFEYDKVVRHAMHDLYTVLRAETPEQLAADFAKGKDLEEEDCKYGESLNNCAIGGSGGANVVQRLIDEGADAYGATDAGTTYLWIAAKNNHPDILKVFMDNTNEEHVVTKCGKRNQTALAVAAQEGNTDCVKVLLAAMSSSMSAEFAHGSKHDDADGETVCHRAAESGKLDTVQALSALNSEFFETRSQGDDGSYPLHYAAMSGSSKVTKYLLNNGYARADAEDYKGKTALHVAVLYGHPEVVQVLIDYGADVDAIEDQDWHTPLGIGALYSEGPRYLDCMHLLGRAGCSIYHKSRRGTALNVAKERLESIEEDEGKDSQAFSVQADVVETLKTILSSVADRTNLFDFYDQYGRKTKDIVDVESEKEELIEYLEHTGIQIPNRTANALASINLGSLDSIVKFFKSDATKVHYLLEVALSDDPKSQSKLTIDALNKDLIKKWQKSRASSKERKAIKKHRASNAKAEKTNEKEAAKLARRGSATALSFDAWTNSTTKTKNHRREYEARDGKIGLPGTPDLCSEEDIREMIVSGAGGCCESCVGDSAYAAAYEGAFDDINVAVTWTYGLTTSFSVRYLKQHLYNGAEDHPSSYASYSGPSGINFHSLPNVYDFSEDDVRAGERSTSVSGHKGIVLPGSCFKKECKRCDGDGEVTCSDCSGQGSSTCSNCSGSGQVESADLGIMALGAAAGYAVASTSWEHCSYCSGTGQRRCYRCSGTGQVQCSDCAGSGYFVGWLAVRIKDSSRTSTYGLSTGVGKSDSLATSVVKQKGGSEPVMASIKKENYGNPDDVSGPAHPTASEHPLRLQPIDTTAVEINVKSMTYLIDDNSKDWFEYEKGSLNRAIEGGYIISKDPCSTQTFSYLSGRTFTDFDGKPGFRMRGQSHRIDWEACAMMRVDVDSIGKSYNCHFSGTGLDLIKVKDYPRGGCCNCGISCCGGCITC